MHVRQHFRHRIASCRFWISIINIQNLFANVSCRYYHRTWSSVAYPLRNFSMKSNASMQVEFTLILLYLYMANCCGGSSFICTGIRRRTLIEWKVIANVVRYRGSETPWNYRPGRRAAPVILLSMRLWRNCAWKVRTTIVCFSIILLSPYLSGWIHHLARHAVACFLTRGDLYQHWEEVHLTWRDHMNPVLMWLCLAL